jgi:mersacidin/lichenicidin family type 2 lantibiotic
MLGGVISDGRCSSHHGQEHRELTLRPPSAIFTEKKRSLLMAQLDIIRAWKDNEYFSGLSESERSRLPGNPAGMMELTDEDLGFAEGGTLTLFTFTIFFCPFSETEQQG